MINREKKFERMIDGLLGEIGGYSHELLKHDVQVKECVGEPTPENVKAPALMLDSIHNLRICVKYLMFDLDATRRECQYYKKLLEDNE